MSKLTDKVLGPEKNCSVCGAFFIETVLDEAGRCKICAGHGYMPGDKSKDDIIQSEEMKTENLKSLIRSLIREVMEEDKKEKKEEKLEKSFAPKKCSRCGNMFTPRAPAAKLCDSCHAELKK